VCHGIRILVTDRNVLDSPLLGIEIAAALHRLFPRDYQLERMNTLLANHQVLQMLMAGVDPERIADDWRDSLENFETKRKLALLY
jgi:uncharacterized protein YbbC (DUF1343 family)